MAGDVIRQLLASDVALDKVGARGISAEEAEQLPRNTHVTVCNSRGSGGRVRRLLLIGQTDGRRTLTLVIESTVGPTTWLLVTGWSSTDPERNLMQSSR